MTFFSATRSEHRNSTCLLHENWWMIPFIFQVGIFSNSLQPHGVSGVGGGSKTSRSGMQSAAAPTYLIFETQQEKDKWLYELTLVSGLFTDMIFPHIYYQNVIDLLGAGQNPFFVSSSIKCYWCFNWCFSQKNKSISCVADGAIKKVLSRDNIFGEKVSKINH